MINHKSNPTLFAGHLPPPPLETLIEQNVINPPQTTTAGAKQTQWREA